MNRRVRSPTRKEVVAAMSEERFLRFLRPGALARLRDSKISARSPRSALKTAPIAVFRFSPPSSPSATAAPQPHDGGDGELIRFFTSRPCGPRKLQRKKLSAAKYVFFSPPSPDPSDSVLDVFSVDLVVAH
ncbi:uncharacterized protein LOC110020152 [Phalaenopsis equestris]|uniref:uncharacterized protein LOC110020152 n=1 Tax=Phalaenopsis equestris TaxID=78828 RepID=UPI0009E3776C|nr:uncharacterized protein LOC110020152 [Phalaenopsis equestris]